MKKFLLLVSILTSFATTVFAEAPTLPRADYVLPQETKIWAKEKKPFTFIDVREAAEYEAGHLEGAVNIPYLEVEKHKDFFKLDHSYVFYCTYSIWRAPFAANVLKDMGFEQSYILTGGASAWNAGGQVIYASNPTDEPKVIPYRKDMPHTLYHSPDKVYKEPINLTLEELAKYDGKGGACLCRGEWCDL